MNSLKKAIVASLTEHPEAEKYRERAFAENPAQFTKSLAQGQSLKKADFFTRDDQGKPFVDSAGAWKNFEKIAEALRLDGEKLTYEDFMTPMPGMQKTLLDSAKENNSVSKVFAADIWEGRFTEMEKLWYQMPILERKAIGGYHGLVPIELKRQIFAAEGKTAPEDRLFKARLILLDIRSASLNDYSFNEVIKKLSLADDHLRKEYVMMVDGSGDTMFDGRKGSFTNYQTVIKALQSHGERLEVEDYLRQLSTAPCILARAAEQGALDKVFVPEQWVGRLSDMIELWSNVLDAWKTSPMTARDFDNAYAEAEGMTYARRFRERSVNGKADLLKPLNEGLNEKPVLPLGLKAVWDNFDAVRGQLSGKGEALTIADLRTPSGQMGDSCLISAAKFGYFNKVTEIARQNGEQITINDFLSKDGHGNTLISILAEKKQLSQVFTADAWVGNISDMRELWSHVGAIYRKQVDFGRVESGVKLAGLQQQRGSGKLKVRPR